MCDDVAISPELALELTTLVLGTDLETARESQLCYSDVHCS